MFGKLVGLSKKSGYTPPLADSLIAATALSHQLTLVTVNIKDFSPLTSFGLTLLNPDI